MKKRVMCWILTGVLLTGCAASPSGNQPGETRPDGSLIIGGDGQNHDGGIGADFDEG